MIFTKLFARFVVKNDLNAIFGANELIFSVKIIIFIKKYKNNCSFLKHIGKILRFFMFLHKNFPKLAKSQNFEENLRILGNFGKFSCKNSKIYGFHPYVFKKLQFSFFVFLIKIIVFYTKNLFIRPKNCVQIIFLQRKMQKVS